MKKEYFTAHLIANELSSNSKQAYTLSKENFFGEKRGETIHYSLQEGLYLFKTKKMRIISNKKELKANEILIKFTKIDKKFPLKYKIYEDMRSKGFILKSGIKYGTDFVVYDKSEKPGKNHSKWLLYIENYSKKTKWEEIILKNRVANSTKKKILLAIEDGESNIIYYEMNWKKI